MLDINAIMGIRANNLQTSPSPPPYDYISAILSREIERNNIPQQFMPVNPPNKVAGTVIVGGIGGVLSQNVVNYLADGMVSSLLKRYIDTPQVRRILIFIYM